MRETFCRACKQTVWLQKSIDANEPLVWVMTDRDGRLHASTCKPIPMRAPKRARSHGPLLPFMADHYQKADGARPPGELPGG